MDFGRHSTKWSVRPSLMPCTESFLMQFLKLNLYFGGFAIGIDSCHCPLINQAELRSCRKLYNRNACNCASRRCSDICLGTYDCTGCVSMLFQRIKGIRTDTAAD